MEVPYFFRYFHAISIIFQVPLAPIFSEVVSPTEIRDLRQASEELRQGLQEQRNALKLIAGEPKGELTCQGDVKAMSRRKAQVQE